jgi:hypothetical protein
METDDLAAVLHRESERLSDTNGPSTTSPLSSDPNPKHEPCSISRSKSTASIKISPLSRPVEFRAGSSCSPADDASSHRLDGIDLNPEFSDVGRGGPSTAVHRVSAAVAGALGSLVKQRGQRKIRPSGSTPRCETRPHATFGQCTISVVMMLLLPPCHRFRRTDSARVLRPKAHSRKGDLRLKKDASNSTEKILSEAGHVQAPRRPCVNDAMIDFNGQFTALQKHAGDLRCYTYNASRGFRKHRSSKDCDEPLPGTVAPGISAKSSPCALKFEHTARPQDRLSRRAQRSGVKLDL